MRAECQCKSSTLSTLTLLSTRPNTETIYPITALLIPRFRYTIITKKYELGSERTNYIIVYQYHAINEQNIHKLYTCCENKISARSEIK